MSELAIFMPTGKVAKQQLEGRLRDMYLSGDHDPLDIEVKMKGVSDAIEAVRKDADVREAVMDCLSAYNEKTINLDGAQVTKRMMPARYAFSQCGDPVYDKLQAQLDELKLEVKAREAFLKALPGKTTIVDDDSGEVYEVIPPPKSQGETLAIKFV